MFAVAAAAAAGVFIVILRPADVGVMSAAILDIEEDMSLSAFEAEVLVGSLNVIAAFGGLIAGALLSVARCEALLP